MYAGFWKRTAAFLIDCIIIWILFIIVILALFFGGSFVNFDNLSEGASVSVQNYSALIFYLFTFGVTVFYWTLFEYSSMQATPGKMALGIKVTDENGQKLNFTQSLSRNLCKIVSNFTAYVGYTMAGITVRKQALHDKMAHCLVIDKDAKPEDLKPLPKAPLFLVIIAVAAPVVPLILIFILGIAAALFLPAVMMASSLKSADVAVNNLHTIKSLQLSYAAKNGVYSDNLDDLLSNKTGSAGEWPGLPKEASPMDNDDFSYGFISSGVWAKYKGVPAYTITSCYKNQNVCIDTDLKQFRKLKLKVAAPEKCCSR